MVIIIITDNQMTIFNIDDCLSLLHNGLFQVITYTSVTGRDVIRWKSSQLQRTYKTWKQNARYTQLDLLVDIHRGIVRRNCRIVWW